MAGALTLPFNNLEYHDPSGNKTDEVMKYLGQFISEHNKLKSDTSLSQGGGTLKTAIGFNEDNSSIFLNLGGVINWVEMALENLNEVYEECSEEDWDGYEAVPVSYQTFFEASRLLRMFPPSLPMPDILAEPDGSIGLEWYRRRGFSFAISLGGKDTIYYAGIFGKNETHGKEEFTDFVPENILENLRRLFPPIS